MEDLILKLHAIGAIKFGSFELKKHFIAPFQIDFTPVLARPEVAKEVCTHLWKKMEHLPCDAVCGVPSIGGCLATFLAWNFGKALLVKDPNKVPHIAGQYKGGAQCLVIQDVLLSGQRTLDLCNSLEEEGLKVRDIVTFIDLELGGRKKVKSRSFVVHSVSTISQVLQIVFDHGKLPGDLFKLYKDFLENESKG